MMVKLGPEAREIMLHDEFVEELRIPPLHHYIPGQRDCAPQQYPRNPERPECYLWSSLQCDKNQNHSCEKKQRYRPFGQSGEGQESVKSDEIFFLAALEPRIPSQHCNAESCRQSHVHGSCMRESNDAGGCSDHQRAIELRSRAKAAQKPINRN